MAVRVHYNIEKRKVQVPAAYRGQIKKVGAAGGSWRHQLFLSAPRLIRAEDTAGAAEDSR